MRPPCIHKLVPHTVHDTHRSTKRCLSPFILSSPLPFEAAHHSPLTAHHSLTTLDAGPVTVLSLSKIWSRKAASSCSIAASQPQLTRNADPKSNLTQKKKKKKKKKNHIERPQQWLVIAVFQERSSRSRLHLLRCLEREKKKLLCVLGCARHCIGSEPHNTR